MSGNDEGGVKRRSLLGLPAVLLSACAATGELFKELQPPEPGKAVLYIYRVQEDVKRSMDLAPAFVVSGKELGNLLLDGYMRVVVDPGPHYITMRSSPYQWPNGAPLKDLSLTAKAGEMHFIEFEMLSARTETIGRVMTTYLGVELRETPRQRAMFYLPRLKKLG